MGGTPRQTFRISEYLWKKFQSKCAAKGYNASEVLRAFIIAVIEGRFNIDNLHPEKARMGEQLVSDEMILEWFQNKQSQ